jgi:hypothetical protein
MRVNFNVTGINHEPFKIRLINQSLKQRFPDAFIAPTAKPTLCVFPIPIAWW